MDQRIYLKVKIKSLMEEARIIRRETKRAKCPYLKNGLALHRTGIVRNEARHTLIAYGFLRGREYEQIEKGCRQSVDWAKVRKMVEKYGSHYQGDYSQWTDTKLENLKRFDEWLVRAKAYHGNTLEL